MDRRTAFDMHFSTVSRVSLQQGHHSGTYNGPSVYRVVGIWQQESGNRPRLGTVQRTTAYPTCCTLTAGIATETSDINSSDVKVAGGVEGRETDREEESGCRSANPNRDLDALPGGPAAMTRFGAQQNVSGIGGMGTM